MEKKRILFVEDEPALQKTLHDYLVAEGFEVFLASNGEEGIHMVKSKKPDLVLLDIILPKKDGYEVIREIKADPETKKIPVILLTNLGSLNDVEKAVQLGASTYLIKSEYTLEEVLGKVKETLGVKEQ